MKLEKIQINNYEVNLYRNDRYSTINIEFLFETDFNKDNYIKYEILKQYLYKTNKKYLKQEDLVMAYRENYRMSASLFTYIDGTKLFIRFGIEILDPKLVEDNYLKSAIELARTVLYDINETDGHLNREEVNNIIKLRIEDFAEMLTHPANIAQRNFNRCLVSDPKYQVLNFFNTAEEVKEYCDNITDKDILDAYHDLLDNCLVGAIIQGNITDELLELIKKNFKFKNTRKIDRRRRYPINIDTNFKEIIETNPMVKEPILYLSYDLDKDFHVKKGALDAIAAICNQVGLLLHETVRTEENLVYHVSGYKDYYFKKFNVVAYVSPENKDKCIKAIERALDKLKDPKIVEKHLKKYKEHISNREYLQDENLEAILSEMDSRVYKLFLPIRTVKTRANKLTSEDIINTVKALKLIRVYYLKGEN